VTESLADVTYWKLTVLIARSHSFKGTQRKSSTSLLDPDRTRFPTDPFCLGHRRERAAFCGKLLKLRDTNGYLKRFR
jgi:predicted nucleic acid binding AN1-type Zn finger protein